MQKLQRVAALSTALLLGACGGNIESETFSTIGATLQSEPPASIGATAEPTPSTTRAPLHEVAASPNPALRDELLAMLAEDQRVRTDPEATDWNAVDAANAARMEEILDEFGWPGWSLVGEDGAEAAWALVQHADLRLELQKRGLALLQAAVDADDASPGDLAYLTDRVLVAEGKPQVYGTQLGVGPDGELIPRTPIQDEANVDARRAAAGLGTLEEYYDEFRRAVEGSP